MAKRLAKKVLLIGWDAADWKVITPLMDAGQMPALESLVNRGVMGNIATLDPPLSPMLWTSIATGHSAVEHGILGFVQPDESGERLAPILGSNRKVKALWNILSQEGLKSNVVSWWPSHPVEPINGSMVSNFFHRATEPVWEPWPVSPGAVHPPALEEVLAPFRVHPAELTRAHIGAFAPFVIEAGSARLDKMDQKRLNALARLTADAATTHAASTWLLENTEWDFTAIYLDAIDHYCHAFMKYHPPSLPGIDEEAARKWGYVVSAAYRMHDMMLAQLLSLSGDDTTVVLVSDHGFHSDHLRPKSLPFEPASAAYEHREYGIFCMAGPSIREDERVYGATLFDVAPTVLTLFGLPVGEDMQGRPLTEAFLTAPDVLKIPSWEVVEGNHGRHRASEKTDPQAQRAVEEEAMQQLVELGYIDEIPQDSGKAAIEASARESRYYLARAYKNTGRLEQAVAILGELVAEAPDQDRYALRLVDCLRELDQLDRAREALDAYAERLKGRMKEKGDERETPGLSMQFGLLALKAGHTDEALSWLERAGKANPHFPALHRRIGAAYLQAKRWTEAEQMFLRAMEIDPDDAGVLRGLALATLRQDRFDETVDYALGAISRRYKFPAAHAHLGEALMRLGYPERAAEAFEVAVSQQPGMRRVHEWLAQLYRTELDDPVRASLHLTIATEHIAPTA